MKKIIKMIIFGLIVGGAAVASLLLYFIKGYSFSDNQLQTLLILGIICGASALYCFVVGEITRNNSQMDKLWSILPIAYVWVIAIKGSMQPRLIIMAILATIWGIRLTINFGMKGAYSIKFWTGVEDYRWQVVRNFKIFKDNKVLYAIFNLFFISIYQNVIVLLTVIPGVIVMESTNALNWIDIVATLMTFGFILYETIADAQQMEFQTTKYKLLGEGKKLSELPEPYNKGFNTTGLWNYSRHPNYIGEQGTWFSFYIFTIAAGAQIFNFTFFGASMLILLFMGSSTLAEYISGSKYPEYNQYCNSVFKYLPVKKYRK